MTRTSPHKKIAEKALAERRVGKLVRNLYEATIKFNVAKHSKLSSQVQYIDNVGSIAIEF